MVRYQIAKSEKTIDKDLEIVMKVIFLKKYRFKEMEIKL